MRRTRDPVYDETIVVGDGGELKNVVVYVKDGVEAGRGGADRPGRAGPEGVRLHRRTWSR